MNINLVVFLALLIVSCNSPVVTNNTIIQPPLQQLHDTTIVINQRLVDIRYPKKQPAIGTILCLPGWNFSRTDMCDKSNFCSAAADSGFILVMPEMGKSIYASSLYPETRKDWLQFPQLSFITDSLFPVLNSEYKFFLPTQNNFVYGISTGGRGVGMLAVFTKHIFKAGASLSGDFNTVTQPTDNLMRGYYGELTEHNDRWEKDCPYIHSDSVSMPLYLAHGKKDNVVPFEQTFLFYQKLNNSFNHKLVVNDTASHNYGYWQSETGNVLKFFKKLCK